jgi:hypothetical protein
MISLMAGNKLIQLNYSLTRLQMLLNPPEVILEQTLCILGVAMGLSFIILRPTVLFFWIMACLVFSISGLYLRRSVKILLVHSVPMCLVIGPDAIGVGDTEPTWWIPLKALKVCRGLAGTHVIRIKTHPGYCVLVPKKEISYLDLKELCISGFLSG